jgi:hypothetical protein
MDSCEYPKVVICGLTCYINQWIEFTVFQNEEWTFFTSFYKETYDYITIFCEYVWSNWFSITHSLSHTHTLCYQICWMIKYGHKTFQGNFTSQTHIILYLELKLSIIDFLTKGSSLHVHVGWEVTLPLHNIACGSVSAHCMPLVHGET